MNFSELKQAVKNITGRNDAAFDTRIGDALNNGLVNWAHEHPWMELRRIVDVTHVSGRTLFLPSEVMKPEWILDKTNYREVEAASRQWDRNRPYALAVNRSGYAFEWELGTAMACFTTPTGPLELYSSVATDTVTVHVTGQVLFPGGTAPIQYYQNGESIVVSGQTGVTSVNSFFRIDSIAKASDSTGVVTVAAAGNPIAHLGPFEREAAYPTVRFMDIPAAGTVFTCGVYTKPARLVNAYQGLPPGVDSQYLIWQAAKEISWQLREGERAQMAQRMAKDVVKDNLTVALQFGDQDHQLVPESKE